MLDDEKNRDLKFLIEHQTDNVLKNFVLVANFLHPMYQGKNLGQYKTSVVQFLVNHSSTEAVTSFLDYEKRRGIFKSLFEQNYTSWKTF